MPSTAALDLIISLKEAALLTLMTQEGLMATARYYDETKNPDGGTFPGVPLADIDDETFNSYPEWLQASIDAAPFYRKTKPDEQRSTRAAKSEKEP